MQSDDIERCATEGCRREADYLMTADTNADGDILDERFERPVCRPCKRSAEFFQAWHPADHSFRPLHTETSQYGGDRDV